VNEQQFQEWLRLKSKIPVKRAAELNNLSEDTFRRRYPDLILDLSPRRQGVELGAALAIGKPKEPHPP
jgi:hypothetical protein